jgi:hypothetical protein
MKMLLLSDSYRNLTIANAIYKYAPPHENNTNGYKSYIKKVTGLNLDKKITTLTSQELEKVLEAICVIEGWKRGHEIKTAAPIRTKQTTIFERKGETILYIYIFNVSSTNLE